MVFSFNYGVCSDNWKLGEIADGPGQSVEVDVAVPVVLVDSAENLLVSPQDDTFFSLIISHIDVKLYYTTMN